MPFATAHAPHALRLPLRPYQAEAIQAILEAQTRGVTRPLVVLPVGAGKTIVFAHLLRQRAGRALVLAHRDELLQQAVAKLRLIDPNAQIGLVKADDNAVDAPVVVASVQTLSRRPRLAQLRAGFATLVVDEAHHATAPTYRRILRHCGAFAADGPLTLGVTATPERQDTARLSEVWQEVVYEQSLLALITAGYLANLRAVQVLLQVNFDALRLRQGDFVDAAVDALLLQADAPQHVVQAYQTHAAGRKALVFTPTVRTAYAMADAFRAAGLAAEALDGTTPAAARQATLARLRTGATQVLANCALLTEGFDEPSIDAIVMARPTLSKPLYIQMLGRGTRLYPGKTDCLILDVVGASTRHALLTTAALFDVDPATLAQRALTAAVAARAPATPAPAPAEMPEGTLVAAAVDLFRARPLHWVQTQRGAWVLTLGQGTLRLLPAADSTWTVVHVLRADAERLRKERRQRAHEAAEQLRRERQRRWMERGGLPGFIGSKFSSAAVTMSSGAKALGIGLRDTVHSVGRRAAAVGSGALYGFEYGVSSVGKAIIYLTTKDPGESLIAGCTIDAERLHRVVEYTRIGQNYQLLLHAAQQVDTLLSDSAQLPRLRLSYSYKDNSIDDVIGHLGGSKKKPDLFLEIESVQLQKLIKGLDGTKSMTYYTLLESLLHHKAHQQQGGAHHGKTFYAAKERLRAQFFDYAQEKHICLEDALDNVINAHRRRGQLQDFVDEKEIARLSQMRILGLLKERGRIQRVYGR